MGLLDKARRKLEGAAGGVRGPRDKQEERGQATRDPTQAELERAEAETRKQSAEREADASRPRS
jgi:hypothetical protein